METTKFSFATMCQFGVSFWVRLGAHVHFPLSAGTPTGLDLCGPCAYCHSLCEFISVLVLLGIEGLVFLESSSSLALKFLRLPLLA